MAEIKLLKNYSFCALIINATAIIFNIFGYVGINTVKSVGIILFLVAVGVNLSLIYITLYLINRSDPIGQKIKRINHISLIFFMFAVLAMSTSSLTYSFFPAGDFIRIISFIISLIGYFGIFGFGVLIILFNILNIDRPETWK